MPLASNTTAIDRDVAQVAQIQAVPILMNLIAEQTQAGLVTVARVVDGRWTACAVWDALSTGLRPGDGLDLSSLGCTQMHEGADAVFYGTPPGVEPDAGPPPLGVPALQRALSVPILRPSGGVFGLLSMVHRDTWRTFDDRTIVLMRSVARLLGQQLDEVAAAQLREEFVAMLGHDLRDPLSTIQTTGWLLAQHRGDETVVRAGHRVVETARRMAHLIEDMLDLARGRRGTGLVAAKEPVPDLGVRLATVIADFRVAHADRVIRERIGVTGTVHCDAGRLQQLLSNLIANAIHHGAPTSAIEVDVQQRNGRLRIAVWNAGPAIPPADLPRLFERYWPQKPHGTGRGLGLGLYICLLIAEGHGGTLRATSTSAHGTRFMAILPAHEAPPSRPD